MKIRFFKRQVLFFILVGILLTNCNQIIEKKGYEISNELRTEIWKIESDICTSMMKRDYDITLSLFNDSIAAKLHNLNYDSVFRNIKYGLFEYTYSGQDIFYQKSLFKNAKVEAYFDDEDFNPFIIRYYHNNNETAVTTALLTHSNIQYCLITIYGKYNNTWKVDYITIGLYMIDGKDAIDWLNEAEEWLSANNYIMAKYSMRMVDWLLNPVPNLWFFENESDVLRKKYNISKKINRNLKIHKLVEKIDSKPKLQDIYPVLSNKKIYPAITYQTKFSITDSLSIEKECLKLDSVLQEIFGKMTQDSLFIKVTPYTEAWNEPDTFLIKKRKLLKYLVIDQSR